MEILFMANVHYCAISGLGRMYCHRHKTISVKFVIQEETKHKRSSLVDLLKTGSNISKWKEKLLHFYNMMCDVL